MRSQGIELTSERSLLELITTNKHLIFAALCGIEPN